MGGKPSAESDSAVEENVKSRDDGERVNRWVDFNAIEQDTLEDYKGEDDDSDAARLSAIRKSDENTSRKLAAMEERTDKKLADMEKKLAGMLQDLLEKK